MTYADPFPLVDEPRVVIVGCPVRGCSEVIWRITDGIQRHHLRNLAYSHLERQHVSLGVREKSLLADAIVQEAGV